MTPLSLPLHPLVVHAAVCFIPMAAMVAIAYALKPSWRWVLRWPTVVVNALAVVVLFVTRETGDMLAHATPDHKDLIERHDQYAGLLTAASVPMALLAIAAAWAFTSTSPLPSGWGAREGRHARLAPVVTGLLVLLGLATLVLTVLTGHSGATAAWAG